MFYTFILFSILQYFNVQHSYEFREGIDNRRMIALHFSNKKCYFTGLPLLCQHPLNQRKGKVCGKTLLKKKKNRNCCNAGRTLTHYVFIIYCIIAIRA